MAGKPIGRRALTPTQRQQRWRLKKRRLAKGAEKRGRRELRLAAMALRTEQARLALNAMAPIYNVIHADTPPKFENWSDQTGMDRAAENHYETMVPALIEAMGNSVPAAPDCVLYLWSTVPMLPAMLTVMVEWGFRYSSHVVWVKTTFSQDKLKFGLGHETRNAHELLLIGKKGNPPAAIRGEQFPSVIFAPRGEHSSKPAVFAETIERMFRLPASPRAHSRATRSLIAAPRTALRYGHTICGRRVSVAVRQRHKGRYRQLSLNVTTRRGTRYRHKSGLHGQSTRHYTLHRHREAHHGSISWQHQ